MESQIKNLIADVFDDVAAGLSGGGFGKRVRIGLTLPGSEHGEAELLRGAELAQAADPTIEIVVIGRKTDTALTLIEADEDSAHEIMDNMLQSGELDGVTTLHYNFPIGVSTIGRVVTPGMGRKMYVASTTGTSDVVRVSAMLKNAIAAIAVAKACGNPDPTIGILNIDGARQLERALLKLQENGYPITFTTSARADGGIVMRGNDLLQGVPDIMVMDSLTGNIVMKTMSAYMTGGSYEAIGDAYGPGVGDGYNKIVNIISRASGAPVVANSLLYTGACAKGKLIEKVNNEFKLAKKADLDAILASFVESVEPAAAAKEITAPPEKVVTEEIAGIEILELEDAVRAVWAKGIYASSGMGCTGPVVLVAPEDKDAAFEVIKEAGYL